MRLSQAWVLACLASQMIVFSAASAPRKLLQFDYNSNDVFPWFTGSSNSMPDNTGSNNKGSPPAMAPGPSSSNNNNSTVSVSGNSTSADGGTPVCPTISLKLNSIEVYDPIINDPDKDLVVICYKKDGVAFPPVVFNTTSDVVRSVSGARYRPSEAVAKIGCGDAISCTVAYSEPGNTNSLTAIAEGGCWFDYRHFTQLSYQEPMSAWTCTKPPVRYTLECIECSDPNFPWADAMALAGPPLADGAGLSENPTLNSVMVIISVSIVAGAVILVVTALLLRGRRRTIEENLRVTELIMARSRDHATSQRRRRSSFKPPTVFVVGKPLDGPPPPGYTGPIVVLHCGEEEKEGGEYNFDEEEFTTNIIKDDKEDEKEEIEVDQASGSGSRQSSGSTPGKNGEDNGMSSKYKGVLRWPQIAIARPEVVVTDEEERTLLEENGQSSGESGESGVAVDPAPTTSAEVEMATMSSSEELVIVPISVLETNSRNANNTRRNSFIY